MSENTPMKTVQKRRKKPEAHDASDFCRVVCKVNFKLNGIYLSCKKLYESKKAVTGKSLPKQNNYWNS